MASFTVEVSGPTSATFTVTGVPLGYEVWFFVRLTSDTSDVTDEYTTYALTSTTVTWTTTKLLPATSYTVNVRIGGSTWIGAQTITTPPEAAAEWSMSTDNWGTLSDSDSAYYAFGAYELKRLTMKFSVSGTATFYATGSSDTIGYLSTTSGYDYSEGVPTTYIKSDDDSGSGSNFSFTYNVTAGTTYYLWVRLYSATKTGSAYVYVDPPTISWSVSSTALGTLSASYSGPCSFDTYVLKRYSVVFAASGKATFYTTGNADTMGYLGTSTGYDSSTGVPTSYLATDDDSGSNYNCSITYEVTAGTTYYFWVRLYSGTATGSVTVCIDPPVNPKAYIFNGSAWVPATPYIYNGSAWVEATPYIYSSGWK